jgi:hypothetical protein
MVNFSKILKEVRDFAESEVPLDLLLIAVNESKAEFTNRVFNSESGTKDTKGKGLGKYSNSYASYRLSIGRQINNVDLELTGSLRRDLKTIRKENSISMRFLATDEVKKIGYLETQYKTSIFDLNEDEKKGVFTKANALFMNEINQIIKDGISKQ